MQPKDSIRGFTLVEVCCVIVIAGILAAVAAPKFLDTPVFDVRGYTDELAAAIRASETAATASGCEVRLTIRRTSYQAEQRAATSQNTCAGRGAFSAAVLAANGTPLAGQAPGDADVPRAATLTFIPQGGLVALTPGSPTTVTIAGTPPGQTLPLTLRLDPLSGFVTVP
jgi:prepilin-type N-terminal cleavage/methylation domain-containing protein